MYKEQVFVLADGVGYGELSGGGTLSSYNEADDLAAGAIQLFEGDGTPIINAAQVTGSNEVDLSSFYWVVGETTADGGIKTRRSNLITRKPFEYSKNAYAAAVLQTSYLGFNGAAGSLNFPATLVVGESVYIAVVDRSRSDMRVRPTQSFEYTIQTGDTETTVIAALVAGFNEATAGGTQLAQATALADGIQFDSLVTGGVFELRYEGDIDPQVDEFGLIDGTSAGQSTTFNPGSGTPTLVAAKWTEAIQRQGYDNPLLLKEFFFSKPSPVNTAETYDEITLAQYSKQRGRQQADAVGSNQRFTIFIPDGASAQATLEAILDALVVTIS